MENGAPRGGVPDVREYLAAERTFLAYIRTSLALMGFGFVVARLPAIGAGGQAAADALLPLAAGTVLVLIGAAVNIVAIFEYRTLVRKLNAIHQANWRLARTPVVMAILLGICGAVICVYLAMGM